MQNISLQDRRSATRLRRDLFKNWTLYLLILPVVAYYLIFAYKPMYGIVIAFKNYIPSRGILGSPWASRHGFQYFIEYFNSMYFWRIVRNTVMLSLYGLFWSFPAPIIMALLFNELRGAPFKRVTQTLTYLPHFVSGVVICGLIRQFSLSDGLFNTVRAVFGLQRTALLQHTRFFRILYIASGIWKDVGWGSIIYLAAITGVDAQLYEAAALDGAGRLRCIWHITLSGIRGTVMLKLIMSVGGILGSNTQKILLLYNESIYEVADTISTYVYRRGLVEGNFSYSAAIDLLNTVIGFVLVLTANTIAKKVADVGLF